MNTTHAEQIQLALSDLPDSRRAVYQELTADEQTAKELVGLTGFARRTVYEALQDLRAEGLATGRLKIRMGKKNVHVWTRGEL